MATNLSFNPELSTQASLGMTGDNSRDQIIASGLTGRQLVDLLASDRAVFAQKALAYFDGDQEQQMVNLLNDVNKGRHRWMEQGLIPRYRNLTKMIIEKSGMLFKDAAPTLDVFTDDESTPDPVQTAALAEEMSKLEWAEFFTNFDQIVRLLKTGVLLVQWNDEDEMLTLDILTRANCEVLLNPNTKKIDTLIYQTSTGDKINQYRVITVDQVIDLIEKENKSVMVSAIQDNPWGIVNAVPFYDTTIPRSGFWVEAPGDLIGINELYNLSLTDSEWSMSFTKRPTLMTNCIPAQDSVEELMVAQVGTSTLPRQVPVTSGSMIGPSKMLLLDSSSAQSPFVKYEAPVVDYKPMNDAVENWVSVFAADWSVRIHTAGEGHITSGFQLVVEEMTNMELRQQRQRMFENGFKRFFKVVKEIYGTVKPGLFSNDSNLFVCFSDPNLPVEAKEQEDMWTIRIQQGRATELDYFREVLGLSDEEANEKFLEIVLFNKKKALLTGTAQQDAAVLDDGSVDQQSGSGDPSTMSSELPNQANGTPNDSSAVTPLVNPSF